LNDLISFLKTKNALFVTPSYLYDRANIERYCGDFFGPTHVSISAVNSLSAGLSASDNCNSVTVNSGADVGFTAEKIIYLKPGFKSLTGSAFKASIVTNSQPSSRVAAPSPSPSKKEYRESSIKVYPNPNKGVFTLDFGDDQLAGSSVVIYNSSGQTIRKLGNLSAQETVDLSSEPSGIYIVLVFSDKKWMDTFKILKK
jgi:hypothetical protein